MQADAGGGGGGRPPRKSIFFILVRLQTQIPDKILWVVNFTKMIVHTFQMADANQATFLWLVIVWSTRVKYLKMLKNLVILLYCRQ